MKRLKKRFQFLRRTATKNASHENVYADTVLKTVPGELKAVRMTERGVAGQVRGEVTHTGIIPYDENVAATGDIYKTEWVISCEGRRFNVVGVNPDRLPSRMMSIELQEVTT